MNELVYYLKMTQKELKIKLYDLLKERQMTPIFEDGFVYAKGNIPVLLVAHMDTVSENPPTDVFYQQKYDMIYNPDGILGGDDRCGVYAIMKLLDKYKPYILFTEDEEIGCIGASKAVEKLDIPDVKYIIEFDRKGKDDCVFYDCGNKKFMHYIEKFGFRTNYGTCSDISILGSAWDIASVNLSCGYYNEHTAKEYVVFEQLLNTINRADNMLKKIMKAPYFDYQEIKYEPYYPTLNELDEAFIRSLGVVSYENSNDSYESESKILTLEKKKKYDFWGFKK